MKSTMNLHRMSSLYDTQVSSVLCLVPCVLCQWTGGKVDVGALPFQQRLQVK